MNKTCFSRVHEISITYLKDVADVDDEGAFESLHGEPLAVLLDLQSLHVVVRLQQQRQATRVGVRRQAQHPVSLLPARRAVVHPHALGLPFEHASQRRWLGADAPSHELQQAIR